MRPHHFKILTRKRKAPPRSSHKVRPTRRLIPTTGNIERHLSLPSHHNLDILQRLPQLLPLLEIDIKRIDLRIPLPIVSQSPSLHHRIKQLIIYPPAGHQQPLHRHPLIFKDNLHHLRRYTWRFPHHFIDDALEVSGVGREDTEEVGVGGSDGGRGLFDGDIIIKFFSHI